jgi:hypothetical protein
MSSPTSTVRPLHERSGLVTFAGIVLIVAGCFNLLVGVVALVKDDYLRADQLLFGDLSAWGFWWIFVGLLQFAAGRAVMKLQDYGMMMGIALAGLNAFTQLMFIGAYPAWSVAIMVLDLIIIYALATSADSFE